MRLLRIPAPFAKKQDGRSNLESIETMLDPNKKLQTAKTAHDKTLLERRIAAADNRIDQLVYKLYALTEEDIAIVEGTSGL